MFGKGLVCIFSSKSNFSLVQAGLILVANAAAASPCCLAQYTFETLNFLCTVVCLSGA